MNQSRKRTVTGSKLCPNGLPALTDKELADRIALIPLPPEDHRRAVLLTVGLVPGQFGLLRRADRDWLMGIAVKHEVLPRLYPKAKRPRHLGAPDQYSDKECEVPAFVMGQLGKIPRRIG